MTKKATERLHVRAILRFYAGATLRYKARLIKVLSLPLANVLLGVFMPLFASKLLADIVTHGPRVWYHFAWFSALALTGFACTLFAYRQSAALQAIVMRDLHNQMFERLLMRSAGFYNNQIGGKLVSDALDFVNSYGQLFNAIFANALGFALVIVIGLVVVCISSWVIGLCLTVLLGGLVYWTVREISRRSDLRSKRLVIGKRLTAHLSDNIVNAVTVKTFAHEQSEYSFSQQLSHDLAAIRTADWQRGYTSDGERMGVLLLMQIMLILVLIWLTDRDPHVLATGIFAFTYTLTLINRFSSVNSIARQVEDTFLQASPMAEILEEPVEIVDTPNAQPLVVAQGEVACKNVTFRYSDSASHEHIFHKLNLIIRPGEKIGLVGHSGGGKSTFTRLLLRFDDIASGSICIDGQDIRSITQTSLRENIAYVPQEPLLFHRTIRENIAYGWPEATDAEVERAARLAYAHDFIAALPQGYDTVVGERGVKLSGGQRQRIAIARAILKNAPILVLDEATSALDSESEKVIQQALWELMEGRTTVVVAHRLSTIQKMDRILVLNNGKIVEDGTHQALLKQGGIYAKLWAHQSGGFIEE
ncbi:MAG TPA: ABC transporter ATP-binding protein [Candidatus Saccharimonadales bacterium]|nr:ABC transporter ATP-binding protein [Candidatus Saccharimonadales bacterium]